MKEMFRLDGKGAIVTGGAGLLGAQFCEALAAVGAQPIIWDINEDAAQGVARRISEKYQVQAIAQKVEITQAASIRKNFDDLIKICPNVQILINNAANNPKVGDNTQINWSRFENFSLEQWDQDILVGLTGAFLCSQVVGTYLAEKKRGVILNIASDLSVIAPDQRLYRQEGLKDSEQPVKQVTYSVIKHGLVGLTKYLATYWPERNVRVNAISPAGVYNNHNEEFVKRLTNLIPMGRMADHDEYNAAVIFLCSDASKFMTGQNIIIDGGRTVL